METMLGGRSERARRGWIAAVPVIGKHAEMLRIRTSGAFTLPRVLLALGAAIICCGIAQAQSPFPSQMPQVPKAIESPKPLALPPQSPAVRRQLTGTGFFVDDNGHLITAHHVIDNCSRVMVAKDQQRVFANVVALSAHQDLALLQVPSTLGIAAVFPSSVHASVNEMVFAGAYDALPGLQVGGGVIANARVLGGAEGGDLAMDSPVTFGASGAPVLDRLGLVQGVVSRRTASDRVVAVGAPQVKAFLVGNGVHIVEDDRPQISGFASRANRAASISVRVTCLQY